MRADDERHGTPAGYNQHRRDDEPACQPCRTAATEAAARRRTYEPVGLTGGAWVLDPVRRVLVWEPAKVVTTASDQRSPIACRRCGARADQTCRSKNGHRTHDHAERTIPRSCSCGGPVQPGHSLCAECKVWKLRRRKVAA